MGFHRESEVISNGRLMKLAGIHSIHTLLKSIKELIQHNFIEMKREGVGQTTKTIYRVIMGQKMTY